MWKSDSPVSPSCCHVLPPSRLLIRPKGFVRPEPGAGWPLLWLLGAFDASQALALAIYLPALALTAIAFAWREADGGEAVEDPGMSGVWLDMSPVSVLAARRQALADVGLVRHAYRDLDPYHHGWARHD